jgi:hypothetical protein
MSKPLHQLGSTFNVQKLFVFASTGVRYPQMPQRKRRMHAHGRPIFLHCDQRQRQARSPNSAEPTRTDVAPNSTAIS